MPLEHHTRAHRTYSEWLADCSSWWDMTGGELVEDYPGLPWRRWYGDGLTVEQAVRRAHQEVFGSPLPWP